MAVVRATTVLSFRGCFSVIARDAEHMAHAMSVEPLDEVLANGE